MGRLFVSDECAGYGHCFAAEPELVELDEDGFVQLPADGMKVAETERQAAEHVVDICPMQALSIVTEKD